MGRHSVVYGPTGVLVLFVCAANLCRSPLAQHLAHAQLVAQGVAADIEVSSAGVSARAGTPMDPVAAAVLVERGLDPTGFLTRRLDAGLIGPAGLILVASRRQRTAVAELDPAAARRTFTLPELARCARHLGPGVLPAAPPAERLRTLVAAAAALRGTVRAAQPREDDVADPHGQGIDAMRACADQLEELTSTWTRA